MFTVDGRYTARGWTEWTEGFQYGSALLQFDATGEREFLELGRARTLERMAPHLTHMGVHDHGFNNVSTYGALWRLAREGRIDADRRGRSGSTSSRSRSAARCRRGAGRRLPDGGYIHSFNGAHSLFVDTIRSLRALALAHLLGQRLVEEQDAQVNLLERLVQHARATAQYNVLLRHAAATATTCAGASAHESLFNVANGTYRGPSTQQGYSPFSTWTRGLAWAMLGFAEQLEFLATRAGRRARRRAAAARRSRRWMLERRARRATYYIDIAACATACPTGIPAPRGSRRSATGATAPADPFNDREPVDSSAAAIAAQGLLRLGRVLDAPRRADGDAVLGRPDCASLDTLFDATGPYLSTDPSHQGLLLHSVYHWPNGWDYVPPGAACRAANRASGATTTRARWRSTCSGSPTSAPVPGVLRSAATPGR